MRGGPTAACSVDPPALTDPWAEAPTEREPTRWWRAPTAVALGAGGLLVACGSTRQAGVIVAFAAVIAGALLTEPSLRVRTASGRWAPGGFARLAAIAAVAVVARPHIGGRQVLLTAIGVALACLALGAWTDERRRPRMVALAIGPLVAAQVVALRHGPDPLLLALLAVDAAILATWRLAPNVVEAAESALSRLLQRLVAVVGAVVLFPVVAVCLYLPGLLVRLGRAIRSTSAAGEASAWQPYGVEIAEEQIDAARPFASTPRPVRVRRHLAGAALVAVAALLVAAAYVRTHRSPEPASSGDLVLTRPSDGSSSTTGPGTTASSAKVPFAAELAAPYSSLPAYRDVEWADELQRAEGNDAQIRSRWVNVHDSVRASLPAPACECEEVTVWFVGGSAAFGYGQRDEHTIASDLVRIGEESGVSIQMSNLGRAGITITGEVQLVRDRLENEDPPDLIVFMDGFNDALFSTSFAFTDSQGTDHRANRDGLGALEYIGEHPDAYLTSPVGRQAGEDVLAYYGAARNEMDRLASERGIATAWFFQPDAFVNPLQLEGYDAVTNIAPAEFIASPLSIALETAADGLAPDGVVDLRPVFETYPRPVFLGLVHQTEEGAALTAEAIYSHLEGQLERLTS